MAQGCDAQPNFKSATAAPHMPNRPHEMPRVGRRRVLDSILRAALVRVTPGPKSGNAMPPTTAAEVVSLVVAKLGVW